MVTRMAPGDIACRLAGHVTVQALISLCAALVVAGCMCGLVQAGEEDRSGDVLAEAKRTPAFIDENHNCIRDEFEATAKFKLKMDGRSGKGASSAFGVYGPRSDETGPIITAIYLPGDSTMRSVCIRIAGLGGADTLRSVIHRCPYTWELRSDRAWPRRVSGKMVVVSEKGIYRGPIRLR